MALSLPSALLAAAPSAPFAFAPPSDGEGGNPFIGLLPLVLIMVIFYLLVIRPQQKRYKDHQKMVQAWAGGTGSSPTAGSTPRSRTSRTTWSCA